MTRNAAEIGSTWVPRAAGVVLALALAISGARCAAVLPEWPGGPPHAPAPGPRQEPAPKSPGAPAPKAPQGSPPSKAPQPSPSPQDPAPPPSDSPAEGPDAGGDAPASYAVAPVFLDGEYAWMGAARPRPGYELGDWWGLLIGHKGEIPPSLSHREVVFNDARVVWEPAGYEVDASGARVLDDAGRPVPKPERAEHGPKWAFRGYDTSGVLEDLVVWRAGDFTKGREGHAIYVNALGDLALRDVHAIECGGQAVQIVWRADETELPRSEWRQAERVITLERVRATDCGVINAGAAVRASWPISIFNPGQALVLRDCTVETVRAPAAHGALFVGHGKEGVRTPSLRVERLKVDVARSDRPEILIWGVDDALLVDCDVRERGGEANVAIADDCGRVEIRNPAGPLKVGIHAASDPHRPPRRTFDVPAGGTFVWPPQ